MGWVCLIRMTMCWALGETTPGFSFGSQGRTFVHFLALPLWYTTYATSNPHPTHFPCRSNTIQLRKVGTIMILPITVGYQVGVFIRPQGFVSRHRICLSYNLQCQHSTISCQGQYSPTQAYVAPATRRVPVWLSRLHTEPYHCLHTKTHATIEFQVRLCRQYTTSNYTRAYKSTYPKHTPVYIQLKLREQKNNGHSWIRIRGQVVLFYGLICLSLKKQLAANPITVWQSDGDTVVLTYEGALDLSQLPWAVQWCYILPSTKHSLISVVKLCKAGCKVNFV